MMITVPDAVKAAIDLVITNDEGGWVLSQDKDGGDGGWTYAGITANTWNHFMPPNTADETLSYSDIFNFLNGQLNSLCASISTVDELKETVYEIYFRNYFNNLIAPDPSIQAMEFSAAVNMGPAQARQIAFGNKTKIGFAHDWLVHYARICQNNPDKLQDLVGWINRVFHYLP